MNSLSQLMRELGGTRLILIGGIGLSVIFILLFMTTRLTTPSLVPLFSQLSPGQSNAIAVQLDVQGVPYKISGNGSELLVPEKQVGQLRMSLAEQGLPSNGSVGYELFDKTDALGTTSFVQNVNNRRALEGELARTISSIDVVTAARVHLVMPERRIFNRKQREATASIIVKTKGARLSPTQISSIQHLVAAAVPDLSPSNISIIDDRGALLARGSDEEGGPETVSADIEDRKQAFEQRLGHKVETMLEKFVGFGNVRAEVSAEMDFNRVSVNAVTFDPDGQVVRSTQSVTEESQSSAANNNTNVSVANSLPDSEASTGGGQGGDLSTDNRLEETVNFEISQTTRTEVHETGQIKRISIAVLVDGSYEFPDPANTANEGESSDDKTKPEPVYIPRTAEEVTQLEVLVKTAIGYSQERGDVVEVINLPFSEMDLEADEEVIPPFLGLAKADYFRIAEIGVLAIVGLLVVLLVLRPLVVRLLEGIQSAQRGLAEAAAANKADMEAAQGTGNPALAPPGSLPPLIGNDGQPMPSLPSKPANSAIDQALNAAGVEGQVKETALKRVGELVSGHPDEALSVVRNWMYEN